MKKMNNKGFSLVELIIVIAIMAILIAVLAPQYLRYVERSRLQSDNSAVGEVANAVKVAAANDNVNTDIGTSCTVDVASVSSGVTSLDAEIQAVCGTAVVFRSNTYGTSTPTLNVTVTGGVVEVQSTDYIDEVGGTAITRQF